MAVITNGALLWDPQVRKELAQCDIVLPSLDAWDEETFGPSIVPWDPWTFRKSSRACGFLPWVYRTTLGGNYALRRRQRQSGFYWSLCPDPSKDPLWPGVYQHLSPSPGWTGCSGRFPDSIQYAVEKLGAISIDMLSAGSFFSEIPDDYRPSFLVLPGTLWTSWGGKFSGKPLSQQEQYPRQAAADSRVECVDL